MAPVDVFSEGTGEVTAAPAFLILDTESVPDGRLLNLVKYPGKNLTPAEAVCKAQAEARERAWNGSDFLPVTFQYPVAVCIIRVGSDFRLQAITCLDAPHFHPQRIVEDFWRGLACYQDKYKNRVRLVTFNGRTFDLPLLEMAAFRYGCSGRSYFDSSRNRYHGGLDLLDWLTNYGAYRLAGGLDLLSKILGKPGKMEVSGDQVYALYLADKLQEINDYCMFDTLDTYFVFLRTRVLAGEISLQEEAALVERARNWLIEKVAELPALGQYLANWGYWQPWPAVTAGRREPRSGAAPGPVARSSLPERQQSPDEEVPDAPEGQQAFLRLGRPASEMAP
jgi:predicted PolB exonuclease-like 3'-5' exonuclease